MFSNTHGKVYSLRSNSGALSFFRITLMHTREELDMLPLGLVATTVKQIVAFSCSRISKKVELLTNTSPDTGFTSNGTSPGGTMEYCSTSKGGRSPSMARTVRTTSSLVAFSHTLPKYKSWSNTTASSSSFMTLRVVLQQSVRDGVGKSSTQTDIVKTVADS